MPSVDRKAYAFFRAHGGYIVGENARCALALARAESLLERAIELEVASVRWDYDDEPYDPGDADSPEDVARYFDSGRWTGPFGCTVATHERPADADDEYRVYRDPDARRPELASESLWGIVVGPRGTDDPYCRVVAAELASELEDDLRQAIGDALDARQEVTCA